MNTSPGAERGAAADRGRLPLTGADCFLRAFDVQTRRWNGASHLAQVVLRLGPGFDPEAFRRTLASVVEANPILRAPIRRHWGVGAPVYRLDLAARAAPPAFALHEAAEAPAEGSVSPLLARRLDEVRSGRRGELLRVDAVRHPDGTDLAFTWLHMLLDGAGSERFVQLLEACGRGERAPHAVPAADRPGAPPDVALPASARERGALARSWQTWMTGLGRLDVRSPAGPLRRVRQTLACDRQTFEAEATARIRERAGALAGVLTPMIFYLAAAVRAHHAVLRKRGAETGSYVVPLPVDLRPKGSEGGIFRTRVSMVWFQVRTALADDLDALLAELAAQRRRAIREGRIAAGAAAMDFARYAPAGLYARMARRALGGELCSFFFAWTGEFCPGLERFFGAPVRDGFHAPSVPPSPGSSLIFSVRSGRLSVTHVRQRGVFTPDELVLLREQLERDLTGAG